jgi:hypothetical protein
MGGENPATPPSPPAAGGAYRVPMKQHATHGTAVIANSYSMQLDL